MQAKTVLSALAYAAAGAGIAFAAWYPGNWLIVLLALPVLWAASAGRVAAGAMWAGYYLVAARDIPVVCARFFSVHGELAATPALLVGVAFWIAQACVLAMPWMVLKPAPAPASRQSGLWWRATLALLVSVLPPIGIVGWVSPLHVASVLAPGAGIYSLVYAVLVFAVLASYHLWLFPVRWPAAIGAAFVLLVAPAASSDSSLRPPPGWVAIDTAMGQLDQGSYAALYARSEALQLAARKAFDAGARVVVMPEEMTGLWRDSTQFWWDSSLTQLKDSRQTLVLGVDLLVSESPRRYADSAIVLGTGSGRFDSRQPVPAGLWRPTAPVSAVLGDLGQDFLTIDGHRAAFSICYEDFLFWPHWRLLLVRPDVLLGLANNWFDDGLAVGQIQRQSITSIARIAGVPLLRAVNVPSSSTPKARP
ncbi:conjugal transfer protein TraB [Ralstonia thomasii]|uniref:Conjugal transfer protein TraB n=1 Tax=Ralstonia thomasii TaxID=3058596 RepID=A0ABN9JCS3_9RALS|nr:conjugal transfer protein TraB [Ralstonia sp. LMG 18095]CAJ0806879.1 hypothetical protein LMG18095_04516 [Ralstonia sp. LMG 18095]